MLMLFYIVGIILLFFFFKQKTAYEMRISDWSSDVCSSDLASSAAAMLATSSAETGAGGWVDIDVVPARKIDLLSLTNGMMTVLGQIGRASCRERVCQYV